MKGLMPLLLGIAGTLFFSWAGLALIPNVQIGHLDPQMDEEGNDAYPVPQSGMVERGRKVYVANGCVYCHTQQVRADYAGSDIDRKWGERRSAPRDYIFDRPVLLGKIRTGPDLANIGKRAPAEDQNGPAVAASNSPAPASAALPAAGGASLVGGNERGPSPASVKTAVAATPSPSPAVAAAGNTPAPNAAPSPVVAATSVSPAPLAPTAANPAASAAPSPIVATAGISPAPPAPAAANPAATPPAPSPVVANAGTSPAPLAPAAVNPSANAATSLDAAPATGSPLQYSAAWHHQHLYDPRSINPDSIMPSFRFLYDKRRVSGERAADALQLVGHDAAREGWEIVPTYDASCLVAYLMSRDQSHALNEVKSVTPPSPPAPGKAAK